MTLQHTRTLDAHLAGSQAGLASLASELDRLQRWGDDLRGRINMNVFRDDYSNIQRGVNAITPAGQNIAFTANVASLLRLPRTRSGRDAWPGGGSRAPQTTPPR